MSVPPPRFPASAPSPSPASSSSWPRPGACGYRYGHPDWCNLGQGQPETGPLPGAPPRVQEVDIGVDDQDYAPVPGIWELRRAVAELYNRLYRGGKRSPLHRAERLHLRRRPLLAHPRGRRARAGEPRPLPARLHRVRGAARHLQAVHLDPHPARRPGGLSLQPRSPPAEITGRGLSAVLLSNPCNPTGRVIADAELGAGSRSRASWAARCWSTSSTRTTCGGRPRTATASSPPRGTWRTWTPTRSCSSTASPRTGATPAGAAAGSSGRRQVIEAVSSSGSFLDGGGSKPLQRAAVPLLEPTRRARRRPRPSAEASSGSARSCCEGLREAGVRFDLEPEGTFYCWGDVSALPAGDQRRDVVLPRGAGAAR